ncbi:MAG TPA: phosphotransferase family protein, partial [Acidimicrobiales bacterium]
DVLEDLLAVECGFQDRIAEMRQQVLEEASDAAAQMSASGISLDEMTEYLRAHLPRAGRLRVTSESVLPGGASKLTVLLRVEGCADLPDEIVLRKDIADGLVDSRVADEYVLLAAAHDAGVLVPRPILAEEDPEVFGGTFLIVERVPGEKLGEFFPDMCKLPDPEKRRAVGVQLAQTLARLHTMDIDRLRDAHLDLDPDIRAQVVKIVEDDHARRAAIVGGPPSPEIDLCRQWIIGNLDLADGEPALVHNDVSMANLMVEGDRLTGLLDWEHARVGVPSMDLGYVKHQVEALMPWEEFTAAYLDNGGSPSACEPESVTFYALLTYLRCAQACMLAGHIFRSGLSHDLRLALAGYDALYRAHQLLARSLVEALGVRSAASSP